MYSSRIHYKNKLKKALTPEQEVRVRLAQTRAIYNKYKRFTKKLLKASQWGLPALEEWINTPRLELDGHTPKECLTQYFCRYLSRRLYLLLIADLGPDFVLPKTNKSLVINYED